jgi:DNA helicase-2/ATP-dependent DNA helicase PcrA
VGELIDRLLEDTGFILALQDEGPEGEDRIDNVKELLSDAHEFQELPPEAPDPEAENAEDLSSLDLYLQQVALLTDVDRHDPDADRVTLMTAHNAKGLEYPFVFIAGLEDGLFPLARAFDEPETLEEERRLFYVAITRARRKLYLLHARRRRRAGEVLAAIPSSFLSPIARELVEECPTPALARLRAQNEPTWKTASGLGSAGYTDGSYDRFGRRQRDVVPEQGSGRVIDYTDAQDAPRFIKGERVRHPAFGRGVIRELTGLGQETKAVIDFDSVGRKKVVLRYANLQKEL